MSDTTKPVPCHWCGGETHLDGWPGARFVSCSVKSCTAYGPNRDTPEAAVTAWNSLSRVWQPIETAPRDGTPVVLIGIYPDGVTWSYQLQCWWQWTARPSPVVKYDGQWVRWHHSMETVPPTHWRPLPAGPGGGA